MNNGDFNYFIQNVEMCSMFWHQITHIVREVIRNEIIKSDTNVFINDGYGSM